MRNQFILILVLLGLNVQISLAQRIFLDALAFYLHTPDVSKLANNAGLGLDIGVAVGTHHIMGKLSGGVTVTTDFTKEIDVEKGIIYNPFAKIEAGVGLYRSNGEKCSKNNADAYSLLGKVGGVYNFNNDIPSNKKFNPVISLYASYFYIRDMIKNSEYFIEPQYNITTKKLGVNFGFLRFFNTNNM